MTIEIPVAGSGVVLVDDDYGYLAAYSWRFHNGGYAVSSTLGRSGTPVFVHRIVLEAMLGRPLLPGEECDHVNGDRRDDRCANLRLASHSQNARNRGKQRNNTSGFKGVTWDKLHERWYAQIWANGINHNLGRYNTPQEAYDAYCRAADELHGEFANYG